MHVKMVIARSLILAALLQTEHPIIEQLFHKKNINTRLSIMQLFEIMIVKLSDSL